MPDEQLLRFIQEYRKRDIKDDEITKDLLSHDWPIEKIQDCFNYLDKPDIQNQSQVLSPNIINPTNAMNQPNKTISKKSNLTPYIIISAIIILLALSFGTFYFFFIKSPSNSVTVAEIQKIAENINPYIPNGYSISHKAKLVEFPSGGILFDTQLVSGENKIGITIMPSNTFECNAPLQKMGNKMVCVYQSASSKSIKWVDEKIDYEVLTGSPNVLIEDLEKITESL